MPQDFFKPENRRRPFKWANKYIAGHEVQDMCSPKPLLPNIPRASTYKPLSKQEIASLLITGFVSASFRPRGESARERHKKILNDYQSLLESTDTDTFDAFYSQYKVAFDKLHQLDDAYEAENANQNQLRAKIGNTSLLQNQCALRKEGLKQNIQFHYNRMNTVDFFSKSNLISGGAFFGILLVMMGSVVLIPTLFTYLLPLPIVIISLGIVCGLTALILAYKDKCDASVEYEAVPKQLETLHSQLTKSRDTLFNIWKEMQCVDFCEDDSAHDGSRPIV